MKRYTVDELIELAQNDQGEDISRPWSYVDNCGCCGGVGAFLKWLDAKESVISQPQETAIAEILAQDGEEQPAEPCEETQRGKAQWADIRKELEEQGKHQHQCGAMPPTCCGIYNHGNVWELLHWDMITPTPVIFCPFCGERLSETSADATVRKAITMLAEIDPEVHGAIRTDLHAAIGHLIRIRDHNALSKI